MDEEARQRIIDDLTSGRFQGGQARFTHWAWTGAYLIARIEFIEDDSGRGIHVLPDQGLTVHGQSEEPHGDQSGRWGPTGIESTWMDASDLFVGDDGRYHGVYEFGHMAEHRIPVVFYEADDPECPRFPQVGDAYTP